MTLLPGLVTNRQLKFELKAGEIVQFQRLQRREEDFKGLLVCQKASSSCSLNILLPPGFMQTTISWQYHILIDRPAAPNLFFEGKSAGGRADKRHVDND
jgi:hypothetical protein